MSSMNWSSLSVPPVSSKTKLSVVASMTPGALRGVGEPQRLGAGLALAGDLDHHELALDGVALDGEVGDAVDRHQPLELVADLLDRLGSCRR